MGLSSYQILERLDACTDPDGKKKTLLITKSGKFLRGNVVEHNVRVSSDGRVRGRIVIKIEGGNQKEIEAGDLASVEAQT